MVRVMDEESDVNRNRPKKPTEEPPDLERRTELKMAVAGALLAPAGLAMAKGALAKKAANIAGVGGSSQYLSVPVQTQDVGGAPPAAVWFNQTLGKYRFQDPVTGAVETLNPDDNDPTGGGGGGTDTDPYLPLMPALQSLAGKTAGTVQYSERVDSGSGLKKVFLVFSGYENDSQTSQVINFPTPFTNPPVVMSTVQGLTFNVTTSSITIVAPNSASTFSGNVSIEGI